MQGHKVKKEVKKKVSLEMGISLFKELEKESIKTGLPISYLIRISLKDRYGLNDEARKKGC